MSIYLSKWIDKSSTNRGELAYLCMYLTAFIGAAPMLLNAEKYNDNMNKIGAVLGDKRKYDVDRMPERLRRKLLQDVCALASGVVSHLFFGWIDSSPLILSITVFDILGSFTSFLTFREHNLKAEVLPIISHGIMGIWGIFILLRKKRV